MPGMVNLTAFLAILCFLSPRSSFGVYVLGNLGIQTTCEFSDCLGNLQIVWNMNSQIAKNSYTEPRCKQVDRQITEKPRTQQRSMDFPGRLVHNDLVLGVIRCKKPNFFKGAPPLHPTRGSGPSTPAGKAT